MSIDRIYLDHAATTPTRPEAIAVMTSVLGSDFNPSSIHAEGRAARSILDGARVSVANMLGAKPREIVFTGGGSEADNLAILGIARARKHAGRHVITSVIEHHAVLHAVDELEADGWTVTRLGVDARGQVASDALRAALRPETTLVTLALANNEIGTIAPIAELAAIAHAAGAHVHTDAVQAPGQLALDVNALGVDTLALSGHKFYAPKGVGALYVRSGTPIAARILGGGQEHGLRAGTENLAGIAAFAAALEFAEAERPAFAARVAGLRDRLADGIAAAIPGVRVNAAGAPRLPNNLSVAFDDAPGDVLLMRLDLEGIAASAGSACAAGSLEPSHVIAALGLPPSAQRSVIRFSLGRTTTADQIDRVLACLPEIVREIRSGASLHPV
jgi:cysteine desulfurase